MTRRQLDGAIARSVDYPEDCRMICRELEGKLGLRVTMLEAQAIWRHYSCTIYFAQWMAVTLDQVVPAAEFFSEEHKP